MKRLLALVALALAPLCSAQTAVSPILQPHANFTDASGNPCALCSLYTFSAGTTTPLPTYTDSSGLYQNTNPVVLDSAGGANIWLGTSNSYKFVLKNSLGVTVWSVDNVKGSGGGISVCSNSYSVQFASGAGTSLSCDVNITINPASHALQIGGAITGPSFTLKNLSTITSSWTLDVTSPSTALSSFGAIPLANLAGEAADSVVMNATGSSAVPTAVVMPSGCTNGVNYSTTTHSWTCALAVVPLSALATQVADSVVMNATGSTAVPSAVGMPTGCTNGVNYSSSTHSWTCVNNSVPTCSGVAPPWYCYTIAPDGTITEWGETSVSPSGNAYNTVTLTLPYAFTTYYEIQGQTLGKASNTGDPTTPPCEALQSKTLSSATWFMARCIIASAGGGNFDNTMTLEWQAKGK